MRVLFSTTAGAGHFGPLIPFARACAAAGHEVRVAAPASFGAAVERAGFAHAPFDDVPPDVMGAVFGRLPGLPRHEANAIVIGEVFGRLDAQAALPGVMSTIDTWRPDVLVREPCEFGSWAAAERAGVPQIVVWIGLAGMAGRFEPILREPLADLRWRAGLPADDRGGFAADASLSLVPAGFDDTALIGGAPIARFRDTSQDLGDARLPEPWGDPEAPLVYVSFGSVTATLGPFGSVYAGVVDALADYPARILLTTGEGFDPAALGTVPTNLHVEQWWPQADVMPAAGAVVGHGGFGTTMTALAAGVPQVVIPLFAADQFDNAERIDAVGAGVCLDGGPEAVTGVPKALDAVLHEPRFRGAAQRIADEIAALPPADAAVALIERIAHGERSLLRDDTLG
jgi:UDP:flavonoid glycosyltransferase YjiC (YdhE family)